MDEVRAAFKDRRLTTSLRVAITATLLVGTTRLVCARMQEVELPLDAAVELLPLLQSSEKSVRREAVLQMGSTRPRNSARYARFDGIDPLDRRLVTALADAALDPDCDVVAAAMQVLPDVILPVGAPADVVARWATRVAPDSAFARAAADALAHANDRWPIDAMLDAVQAERKRETPALSPSLLALAETILYSQVSEAARAEPLGVRRRLEVDEGSKSSLPSEAPLAEVSDDMMMRLRSLEKGVAAAAFNELERIPFDHRLPASLLAPLVEFARRIPVTAYGRALEQIDRCALDADPAPLADLWRNWRFRAAAEMRLEIPGRLVPTIVMRGAAAESVLHVLVREGGAEERHEVASYLERSDFSFGASPVGDAVLLELVTKHGDENRHELLRALKGHPAVVSEVLPTVSGWLAGHEWRETVAVIALAGEAASPWVGPIVERCYQERRSLASIASDLAQIGQAAADPLCTAFDATIEPEPRVQLAAALLAIGVRRDEAFGSLMSMIGDAHLDLGVVQEALVEAARAAPHEVSLRVECRRILLDVQANDGREVLLRDAAWRALAIHFALRVDRDGRLQAD